MSAETLPGAGSGKGPAARLRSGARWFWTMGLAAPVVAGIVLAIAVGVVLVSPRYQPADMISAGPFTRLEVGRPEYNDEHRFWLVRLPTDGIVVLQNRDPATGCAVPWRPGLEFMDARGWFRDACSGSIYDLEGRCFSGPCTRGLNRLSVLLQNAEVIIKLDEVREGPPADFSAKPVTPPEGDR